MLDHRLTAITAWQIQVDVRPLTAFFGEKSLEQQLHADGIDGGDAEAVAHGAIRRRASALHEDVLLAAVIDDVPYDQEVTGKIEFLDQVEFAIDLVTRLVMERPIAIARADLGDLAQKRHLRLAIRDGIRREAIPEIVHRELQAIGQIQRRSHRVRPIGKQPHHLRRRLEVAFGIGGQPPPRLHQRHVLADRRQHVEQRTVLRCGKRHATGRNQRHAIRIRQAH